MSRLPIRTRLTAAFALAMVALLAGAALFVYLRLESDLDDAINDALAARVDEVAKPAGLLVGRLEARAGAPRDAEDGFTHVINEAGRIEDAAGGYRRPVLSAAELERAIAGEAVIVEHSVPGIDGTTRILARAANTPGEPSVIAAGQSPEDGDETMSNLVTSFAIGGPVAVLLASLLGYLLAAAGLGPIEAMRRRAGEISLGGEEKLLPLPAARDEVRRLGETLNEMLGRLNASFERERRFVGDASHELRTPIAVIKAELEGALRSGELGPDAREAVAAAVEECDSLAALAEDLLVLARSADGELPVRREPLDTTKLLEGTRDRFADRAAERGRTIRVVPDGAHELNADPLRMRQALGNLVDNALRHGEGEVVLRAGAAAGGVALEVSDAGPGFEAALATSAFERFTRGDVARTRGGAGLGLAIVRAVAEAHGGRVSIVGGEGATIRVWLPARG
ncbi:MAG: ATP-binding protein [Solirubrobacterales bacterium]